MKACFLITLPIIAGFCSAVLSSEDENFFESRVRPLLAKQCYECHRRKAEGGLRLDFLDGMMKGGEFVREQIAGDLMPVHDDDETWQRVIATGYIAISRRIGVSPHGQRHITIEDTLNNLGKTFLGLSIGCARCHDHKFDPIPTADYYALYGIFDSTVYPHAGAEQQLGLDHERLTYRHAGRDFRLTDVHGRVVQEILA